MTEYRLRFAKMENLKFLSHLELIKTLERAVRRAEVPLAYSEGFHPHAKLSFGPALAVGISSSDEYFDMQLLHHWEACELQQKLNHVLPAGLSIFEVREITQRVKPLSAIINRASYEVDLRVDPAIMDDIQRQLLGLIEQVEIQILRKSKENEKLVNIRPWLHKLTTEILAKDRIRVCLVGEIGSGGNLRPEELTKMITVPFEIIQITRTGLWNEEKGRVNKVLDLCDISGGNV